jgi:membrane-associated protease RseP (regulator of RpoE activity)
MSIVGASRAAGEVASTDRIGAADKVATLFSLLGSVNLFVALFNFVPLLPLDGGHIAGALYEALKRALARVFRRPDPGHVDTAKMLPVAYVVGAVIAVSGVVLILADIIDPIRLF